MNHPCYLASYWLHDDTAGPCRSTLCHLCCIVSSVAGPHGRRSRRGEAERNKKAGIDDDASDTSGFVFGCFLADLCGWGGSTWARRRAAGLQEGGLVVEDHWSERGSSAGSGGLRRSAGP